MHLKKVLGMAFALLGLACSGVAISWSLFVWWDAALKLWKVGGGMPVTFFGANTVVAIVGIAALAVVAAILDRFWVRSEGAVRSIAWIAMLSTVATLSVLIGIRYEVFAILVAVGKS